MSQQEVRVADLISHIIRTYWYSACYDEEGGEGLLVDTGVPNESGEFDLRLYKRKGVSQEYRIKVTLTEVGWGQ